MEDSKNQYGGARSGAGRPPKESVRREFTLSSNSDTKLLALEQHFKAQGKTEDGKTYTKTTVVEMALDELHQRIFNK
jgi:hypothetical protein